MSRFVALVAVGLGTTCHDGIVKSEAGGADGSGSADAFVRRDAARIEDPVFIFHCRITAAEPHRTHAAVEKDGLQNRFCSRELELETPEPLAIAADESQPEEIKQWTLDVGGIALSVRVDSEWSDLVGKGWRPSEIEQVVYPAAYGRTARRVRGDAVKREVDLILASDRILRVHFAYETLLERAAPIDLMIDRVYSPICNRALGCER